MIINSIMNLIRDYYNMTSSIEISCFYMDNKYEPINIVFIKYEKFMKIYVQEKMMTILIEKLKYYELFYNIYLLSLLCTIDTSHICKKFKKKDKRISYGIYTKRNSHNLYIYDYYDVIELQSNRFKNPFLSKEPKRETSFKKQNKIFKLVRYLNEYSVLPNSLLMIHTFISDNIEDTKINEIINYEKKIYLLCCIRHMNIDIYHNIMKFM